MLVDKVDEPVVNFLWIGIVMLFQKCIVNFLNCLKKFCWNSIMFTKMQ